MRFNRVSKPLGVQLLIALLCLFAELQTSRATVVYWGNMKADRILFLGNSITMHSPNPSIGWTNNWGMAASGMGNDYVHVLTSAIDARTGGNLQVTPTDPRDHQPDRRLHHGRPCQ